jgi:sulfofructose kinase
VTCGEAGSWWLTNDGPLHVPAPEVEAVDTLGAGDVFHGAYALAISEGRDIGSAARFATLAAAIKCTRSGGRAGSPTRAEVAAFAARAPR